MKLLYTYLAFDNTKMAVCETKDGVQKTYPFSVYKKYFYKKTQKKAFF